MRIPEIDIEVSNEKILFALFILFLVILWYFIHTSTYAHVFYNVTTGHI